MPHVLHLHGRLVGERGSEGSRRELTEEGRFTLACRGCEGRRGRLQVRGRGGGSGQLFPAFPDPLIPAFRPPRRRVHLLAVKTRSRAVSVCAALADLPLLPSSRDTFQPRQRARHPRRHRKVEMSHASQPTLATLLVEHHVILKLMLRTRGRD